MAPKASATKPVNLGTKRVCPKCAAKFYDFAKSQIECPKCGTDIDVTKLSVAPPAAFKPTQVAKEVEAADTEVTPAADGFESLDTLDDDDETIVEELADDTSDDSDNY
jgi:uncharacterized protein (TIGR02300 family)